MAPREIVRVSGGDSGDAVGEPRVIIWVRGGGRAGAEGDRQGERRRHYEVYDGHVA